jgi:hypothetical protein
MQRLMHLGYPFSGRRPEVRFPKRKVHFLPHAGHSEDRLRQIHPPPQSFQTTCFVGFWQKVWGRCPVDTLIDAQSRVLFELQAQVVYQHLW